MLSPGTTSSPALSRDALLAMRPAALRRALAAGHPIDPVALDDSAYRGISLGLPSIIEALSWKTFRKVFHRDTNRGVLRGWNVRLRQDGLDAPSVPLMRRGAPLSFGHYEVVAADGRGVPDDCRRGLLIHYGRGKNGRLDPIGRLRDPIVALEAGSVQRLLGWSYVEVAGRVVSTPSFFLLEREGPLGDIVDP